MGKEAGDAMEDKVRETVETYFRLVNEEKFDEFFELFDPDVEFKAPFNFRTQGLDNVKPFYLRVPDDYPEHVDTPEEILVSGERAAVFIDFNRGFAIQGCRLDRRSRTGRHDIRNFALFRQSVVIDLRWTAVNTQNSDI